MLHCRKRSNERVVEIPGIPHLCVDAEKEYFYEAKWKCRAQKYKLIRGMVVRLDTLSSKEMIFQPRKDQSENERILALDQTKYLEVPPAQFHIGDPHFQIGLYHSYLVKISG